MQYEYKTQGTCSQRILFEIEDGKVHNVQFLGGCNGNLKGIGSLVEGMDVDALRKLGDSLKEKESNLFTLLAGVNGDKITFVAMATANAVKNGVHSGKIIKEVATFAGGGGGGKPDAAQAGGKDVTKVDGALALVKSLI